MSSMHESRDEHRDPDRLAQRRAMLAGLGGLAAGAMLTRSASAGDLNPPAGPLGPTMKSLDIVEPRIPIGPDTTPGNSGATYRITQPGSYYLTGNVQGESGKHGVLIIASGVTLDLMGFTLQGVPGSLAGVATSSLRNNITVRNGHVQDWGSTGVDLARGGFGAGSLVEYVHASGNGTYGIRSNQNSIVRCCTVTSSASYGLIAPANSIVDSAAVRNNLSSGILTSTNCLVIGCSIAGNSSHGVELGDNSVVCNCTAVINGGSGFSLSMSSTVTNCVATANAVHGITGSIDNAIRANTCRFNGTGGSGTAGAGIRATGADNLIEHNNCVDNGTGVQSSSGNFIRGNVCSGNTTNWNIAAGSKCLVVNGVNAAAILGNSGGVSPGSTDPNANFTY